MTVEGGTPGSQISARSVARGSLWSSLGLYWRVGFGFGCTVVMTRMLSPEAFGQYAYAMFFVGLLHLQPKLGLRVPFIQGQEGKPEALGTYLVLETVAALATLPLLLVALPFLPAAVRTIVWVMTAFLVAQSIVGTLGTLLDRELQFSTVAGIQSVAMTLSYVPALWLAARGAGVWALVSQPVAQGVVASVALVWVFRQQLPSIWSSWRRFEPALAWRFVQMSAMVGLGGLASSLNASADNYLVARFAGTTRLGYYDRAYRTAQWPTLLLAGVLSQNAFLTYARLQGRREALERAVDMLLWVITTCAIPVALLLIITGRDLVVLLYGERWSPAVPYLRLLAVVFALQPLWDNGASFLVAVGDARASTMVALTRLSILVVAGVPLTGAWGAMGTCVAVGLGCGAAAVLVCLRMSRHVDVAWVPRLAVPAVVALVTAAGAAAINRATGLNDLQIAARVAIKAAYAGSAFFALTFLAQPRASRERLAYVWRLLVNR